MKRHLFILVLFTVVLTACGTNKSVEDHSSKDMNHEGIKSEDQTKDGASHNHDAVDSDEGGKAIKADAIKAIWTFAGGKKSQSGQDTPIRIEINNSGKPIESFDTNHEKKQHLIIVSKDLSYFNHIHPVYKGKGVFEVTTQFPAGGDYKLIADFVPTGGSAMNKMEWIVVEGEPAKVVPIQPETDLTQVVDGKLVTLAFDQLAANKELMLTYTIKDEKTKDPIKNLQPYLGAVGHVVILTEDAEEYLHVHPMEEKVSGPYAKFMTTFPKSGVYKIWGQFKHNDQVFTVPFVVKIP